MTREIHYLGYTEQEAGGKLDFIIRLGSDMKPIIYATETQLNVFDDIKMFENRKEMLEAYLGDIGPLSLQICIYHLQFDMNMLINTCSELKIDIPKSLGDIDEFFDLTSIKVRKVVGSNKTLAIPYGRQTNRVKTSFDLYYEDLLVHCGTTHGIKHGMRMDELVGMSKSGETLSKIDYVVETIKELQELWNLINDGGKYELPYRNKEGIPIVK